MNIGYFNARGINDIEHWFKLEIDDVGRLSRTPASQPMKKADLNAIQEFYDLFGTKETFTVDEFLNARKQLDNIAKFEAGKTDASR